MSKYHDDQTTASGSIGIGISDAKLRRLQPELYGLRAWFFAFWWGNHRLDARQARTMLAEHMSLGDSRAAVVVRTEPSLRVAAYSAEHDTVLLLRFPAFLVGEYQLRAGTRLLTVNTYGEGPVTERDIIEGLGSFRRWAHCYPIIAEFVSDDLDVIERRKQAIDESDWQHAGRIANTFNAIPYVSVRDGRPLRSLYAGYPSQT